MIVVIQTSLEGLEGVYINNEHLFQLNYLKIKYEFCYRLITYKCYAEITH
jgi:hypothetical protein